MKNKVKPVEQINWTWMKRNLHEQGFEKLVEKINELVDRANGIIPEEITKVNDAAE